MVHRLLLQATLAVLPFDGPCLAPRDIHPAGPLEEPSGIVFHEKRGTLFAVCDEGRVAELRPDGRLAMWLSLGKHDLEGITVGPEGHLYVAVENPPAIKVLDTQLRIVREIRIDPIFEGRQVLCLRPDAGIEGICYVPETTTFFVVNQFEPVRLLELAIDDEGARVKRVVADLDEKVECASDLLWDPASKHLLITSSGLRGGDGRERPGKVFEVTLGGEVVRERRLPGESQEGLCLDPAGNAYVACDSGGILRCEPYRPPSR